MTISTETKPTDKASAIVRELDELMDYMDEETVKQDQSKQNDQELMDPSFFIGNITESGPDVPTLTTVANETPAEKPETQEPPRQPGLFSARVEQIKKQGTETPDRQSAHLSEHSERLQQEATQETLTPTEERLIAIADALVDEYLPQIEAQLRERILASLREGK